MSNTQLEPQNDDDLDFGSGEEVQPEQQPEVKPPADPVQQALADLRGEIKSLAPKPEEPKPRQMTPDEEAEYFRVYNPTKSRPDFFKKFFNLGDDADEMTVKERQELFADMQQGLVRQSATAAAYMIKQLEAQFEQRYAPLMEHYQQAQAKEIRDSFNGAYPALADPKFSALLRAKAESLRDKSFPTREEYFKVLAESTAADIKAIVPDFDLGAGASKSKPTPGTTPRTPRTSVGGSGGAGGGGAKPATRDKSADIFE